MRTLLTILCALVLAASLQGQAIGGKVAIGGKIAIGGGIGSSGFTPSFSVIAPCTTSSGTGCTTSNANASAGQFAACGVIDSAVMTTFTVTDSNGAGDTITYPAGNVTGNYVDGALALVKINTSNASLTFTLTTNATSGGATGGCVIYNGTPSSGWDIPFNYANNVTTTSWVTNSGTTTAASELAIAMFGNSGFTSNPSWSGTSGYTCRFTVFISSGGVNMSLCDKVLSATGSQQGAASSAVSGDGNGFLSTIK